MKAVFALIAFAAVVGLSMTEEYDNTDGKPVCTASNTEIGSFRNNYDPTRYWKCSTVGQEPEVVLCPQETGYEASLQTCVPWSEWVSAPFENPPTA